ncbi:hypothetical protein P9112_014298 [Eukaryota sp. TZLM1-RC]
MPKGTSSTTISNRWKIVKQIGEGTFGSVHQGVHTETGQVVAIKHMKAKYSSWADCASLKEVRCLKRLSHPNIVKLHDIVLDNSELFLVFEYCQCNLYEYIKHRERPLPETRCRLICYQVLRALTYTHEHGFFHRDLKPENILITPESTSITVKLADFGSCRTLHSQPPFTEYISTRWYRAPECLLTDGHYSYKMDLFALGCILFEILTSKPLFPGKDEFDQITRIHSVLGTPSPAIINRFKKKGSHIQHWNFSLQRGCGLEPLLPGISAGCVDLITKLLAYLPEDRITAKQALRHAWFGDLKSREVKHESSGRKENTGEFVLPKIGNDGKRSSEVQDKVKNNEKRSELVRKKKTEQPKQQYARSNEVKKSLEVKLKPSNQTVTQSKILNTMTVPLSVYPSLPAVNQNKVLARSIYGKPQNIKKKEGLSAFGSLVPKTKKKSGLGGLGGGNSAKFASKYHSLLKL